MSICNIVLYNYKAIAPSALKKHVNKDEYQNTLRNGSVINPRSLCLRFFNPKN